MPFPQFIAGTVINPDEVNADFARFQDALNRTGGAITGNITVGAGITIDGVDIGAVLGGTGTPTFATLTTTGLATLNSLAVTTSVTVGTTLGVTGAITGNANSAFSTAAAGVSLFDIRTTNSGSTTITAVRVGNDLAANAAILDVPSSGFASAGAFVADTPVLASNRPGGLNIGAHDAAGAIRFYTGGQALRATLDSAGDLSLTGDLSLAAGRVTSVGATNSATEVLTGLISPPQLAADVDNYNPAGLSTARIIRINALGGDGSHNITGLVGQAPGTVISIVLIGGTLTFVSQSVSSTVGNRFDFAATIVFPQQNVTIWYDATTAIWRRI